jgi:hypothetical protein
MKMNPLQRAIVRTCTDAAYRARLLADPRKALAYGALCSQRAYVGVAEANL